MKAMLLAVAYSANIGGIGTLIGTPVNLILVDQLQTVFIENKEEINFFHLLFQILQNMWVKSQTPIIKI